VPKMFVYCLLRGLSTQVNKSQIEKILVNQFLI
jgi:hypothetical protein